MGTTTDQTLFSRLQYQMLEPPDGGASWPSGLWGRDEVLALTNQRQNRLLKQTLLLLSVSPLFPVAAGQHIVPLPTDWIRTAGVVWHGADGSHIAIERSDAFDADHNLITWENTTATKPLVYMDDDAPDTLEIQIAPAPTLAGSINYVYVKLATELNGNGVAITIPDEFEATLRYGVLADLLGKDGRGRDPNRAAYAEERFQLGVEASEIILRGWA